MLERLFLWLLNGVPVRPGLSNLPCLFHGISRGSFQKWSEIPEKVVSGVKSPSGTLSNRREGL